MSDVNALQPGNVFYLEEESIVTGAVARKYYKFLANEGFQVSVEPSSVVSEAHFTDLPAEKLSLEDISGFMMAEEDDHET